MDNNVLLLLDGGTEENLIKKLNLNVEEHNIEVLDSNEISKNSILYALIKYVKYILSCYKESEPFSIPINNIEYQVIKRYSMIIIQCVEKDLTTIVRIDEMYSNKNGWAVLLGEKI